MERRIQIYTVNSEKFRSVSARKFIAEFADEKTASIILTIFLRKIRASTKLSL